MTDSTSAEGMPWTRCNQCGEAAHGSIPCNLARPPAVAQAPAAEPVPIYGTLRCVACGAVNWLADASPPVGPDVALRHDALLWSEWCKYVGRRGVKEFLKYLSELMIKRPDLFTTTEIAALRAAIDAALGQTGENQP